jgi:hypothetical protein
MLLVYDPAIPAQEAYTTGTAGLSILNGNGFTTVTLNPTYVQRKDSPPHYEYNSQFYTSPFLNIVCDVGTRSTTSTDDENAYADCTAYIVFRFATLERAILTEKPVMSWMDVVMNVGSYFALVQFVCWVISGLAWTGSDSVAVRDFAVPSRREISISEKT